MVIRFAFALLLGLSSTSFAHQREKLCDGFLPENSLWIPDDGIRAMGIGKGQFDEVLNRLYAEYAPDISRMGARFLIERRWSDGTVNAYANRQGRNWIISMFGGFARHPKITYDGFAAVACHEVGHHLGGAPKYPRDWASNEGQSDYFAMLKCLRRLFLRDDNQAILDQMEVDPYAIAKCEEEHRGKQDQLICIRSTMAALSLAGVLSDLDGGRIIRLDTPDPRKVFQTSHRHPAAQCRLDTMFQASLCRVPFTEPLNDRDFRRGSCYDSRVHQYGHRPRCWFAPMMIW